ncbi:MAG: SDR family NAD(P)-dependent oxidoreductase, partial [Oceanospirillaceae bacterium]|nr:SDR family NAD(P)-dependent oxidoreductase [Oceanospirillaceae bacterium]
MAINHLSLTGKIALITGASSGLGKQFALSMAEAGATVVIAARRMERLQALAADIENKGGRAMPVALDVTDNN